MASKFLKDMSVIDSEWPEDEKANLLQPKAKNKNHTKIINRFEKSDFPPDLDEIELLTFIESTTGYRFKTKQILATALTHVSKAKRSYGTIWNDYSVLEFLGDSVLQFFNCKRVIRKKNDLLNQKDKKFTDVQTLKLLKTKAEKNVLLGFICVDSGIYKYIRYDTGCRKMIKKYAKYVEAEGNYLELEDLEQYHVSMLADVIEAIIGAILLDSFDIQVTENAWLHLCERYLEKFADMLKIPPNRSFTNFCEDTEFLKNFKNGTTEVSTLTKENLEQQYNINYNS